MVTVKNTNNVLQGYLYPDSIQEKIPITPNAYWYSGCNYLVFFEVLFYYDIRGREREREGRDYM
jgi:hypothetical protein